MALKTSKSSIAGAKELEERVMAVAPDSVYDSDAEIDELAEKLFPSGVALVTSTYRREGGAEYTARGQEIPYEEAIPNATGLMINMSRAMRDPTTKAVVPGNEICEWEKLPFRTDNCKMVKKQRFSSMDVIKFVMRMPAYEENRIEMLPITAEQKAYERQIGKENRAQILEKARAGFTTVEEYADKGRSIPPQKSPTDSVVRPQIPQRPGVVT